MLLKFNSIRLFFVLSFGLILILYSCKPTQVVTEKPTETYTNVEYKPTESVINIPLSIKAETIENKINSQLTGLLYEDNNMDDDNMILKVWKKDKISINISGTTVDYRIPLKIWVKAGMKTFGTLLTKEMDLELALRYQTKLTISPDWNFTTQTIPLDAEWITSPSLDFGIIKIPVQTMANLILTGTQGMISREIDKQIKQNLILKPIIEQVWTMFQKPYLVDDEYHLWLKMLPNEILMSPITSSNGILSSTIGIKSITEIFVSELSPKYLESKKLPNFNILPKVDNKLVLNLGIDIPFNEAEKIAMKTIVGQTFTEGKRKVTIKGIKLYGSNNKLVVSTEIEGSLNGKIFVTGIPYYNSATSSVELKDAEFDIKTKNVLVKSANWLFHSGIVKKMQQSMVFPIGPELASTKKSINQNLQNNKKVKGIVLNGSMNDLNIKEIILTPASFKIVGFATGTINLIVEGLDL